jgi:asparagine synthase (glutamine-hydrolysing)
MLSGWGGDEAVSARTNGGLSEFFVGAQWNSFRAVAGFRMDVADGPEISKALLRARKVGGIVRDIVIPRLPDSVFALFFNDVWLRNENNCAAPSFARLHKGRVESLRGPAFRRQPGIGASICRLLEYGHIVKRMEHWAASGAWERLVYRYPLLDRRLVEFALGIPAIQHCRTKGHDPIFRQAVLGLMPASCDWDRRKEEASTLGSLKKTWFSAHEDWARRLMSDPSPGRFVDREIIRRVVLGGQRPNKMSAWSGIREGFACYALRDSEVL